MTARERPRVPGPSARGAEFIVVTGLSGAGKSHAIRALEDLGYFCVDNLPMALIPTFADLTLGQHRQIRRARPWSSTFASGQRADRDFPPCIAG